MKPVRVHQRQPESILCIIEYLAFSPSHDFASYPSPSPLLSHLLMLAGRLPYGMGGGGGVGRSQIIRRRETVLYNPLTTLWGQRYMYSISEFVNPRHPVTKNTKCNSHCMQVIWSFSSDWVRITRQYRCFKQKNGVILKGPSGPNLSNYQRRWMSPIVYTWSFRWRVTRRVGNFRQKNYSAEVGIDGTNGYFRQNSGRSAEQKTLGIPFRTFPRKRKQLGIPIHGTKIETNSRKSVPNPSVEQKLEANSRTRNSIPWNKTRSKLSECCSEPFRGRENI